MLADRAVVHGHCHAVHGDAVVEGVEPMNWQKVDALIAEDKTLSGGCLNCPPAYGVAPMNTLIAVGFGDANISKDGEVVFSEQDSDEFHFLEEFEAKAKADPDHDWRLLLDAPLHSREYQRHDEGKWVLIAQGEGFA